MFPPAFWKPLDFEFWSKLEWHSDGKEILEIVESRFGRENIVLCTSPSSNYGCHDGKLRWIERHMDRHYKHNIIFSHHKELNVAHDTVLVDDGDHNIDRFIKRGESLGINAQTIQIPRIWNRHHEHRDRSVCYLKEKLNALHTG